MYWWNFVWVIVPVAAIVAWMVRENARYRAQGRSTDSLGASELKSVVEQNTAVNRQLLEKLDSLEGRLASVEKTLNDIP
jgi:TolA-binding protein